MIWSSSSGKPLGHLDLARCTVCYRDAERVLSARWSYVLASQYSLPSSAIFLQDTNGQDKELESHRNSFMIGNPIEESDFNALHPSSRSLEIAPDVKIAAPVSTQAANSSAVFEIISPKRKQPLVLVCASPSHAVTWARDVHHSIQQCVLEASRVEKALSISYTHTRTSDSGSVLSGSANNRNGHNNNNNNNNNNKGRKDSG